jgi:hypothetical protein
VICQAFFLAAIEPKSVEGGEVDGEYPDKPSLLPVPVTGECGTKKG